MYDRNIERTTVGKGSEGESKQATKNKVINTIMKKVMQEKDERAKRIN